MRKILSACALLAMLTLAPGTTIQAAEPGDGSAFIETVEKHIQAIKDRDLESLLSTITNGEMLTLVFPNGTTLYTRQEYVDFHRAWFADTGWNMEIEMLSPLVRGDYGVALTRTTYTDEAGSRQAMLSLHFVREDGEWRLVFDQNTRINPD